MEPLKLVSYLIRLFLPQFITICVLFSSSLVYSDQQPKNKEAEIPLNIKRLLLTENYQKATLLLEALAKHGHAEAMYQLGLMHHTGKGTPTNLNEAKKWYQQAAGHGHAKSLFSLAHLLYQQEGLTDNVRRYLENAEKAGHLKAKARLDQLSKSHSSNDLKRQGKFEDAIKSGDLKTVTTMLHSGFQLERMKKQGRDPLLIALQEHQFAIFNSLLDYVDLKAWQKEDATPLLHHAIQLHEYEALEALINHDKTLLEYTDTNGMTPLYLSVSLRDKRAVGLLLKAGANPKTQLNNRSAATLAQDKGDKQVLSLLSKYGATPSNVSTKLSIQDRYKNLKYQLTLPTYSKWDEFTLATWLGDRELLNWLIQQKTPGKEALKKSYSISLKNTNSGLSMDIFNVLLLKRPSLEEVNQFLMQSIENDRAELFTHQYETLLRKARVPANEKGLWLCKASYLGNEMLVKYILDLKPENRIYGESGESCLILAVKAKHDSIVTLLLDSNLDHQDNLGRTALWYAADTGNTKAVTDILSKSPDLNLQDQEGYTALMRAVFSLSDIITQQLVNAGADTSLVTKEGNSALHIAAAKNNAQVLKVLIKSGMGIEERNQASDTPLMIAVKANALSNVETLIRAGANPKRKNKFGQSAIKLASTQAMKNKLVQLN